MKNSIISLRESILKRLMEPRPSFAIKIKGATQVQKKAYRDYALWLKGYNQRACLQFIYRLLAAVR